MAPGSRPTRPGLVLLIAAVLVVPALVLVIAGEAEAAPTKVLTIRGDTARPLVAFSGFDGNPARTFDFDGDGDQEIIAQNDNQYAYVFDARTGAILAQLKTTFPSSWGARSFNGPEAYREDGVAYLVLANSAATITKYRFDANASTATSFAFAKVWEKRLASCFANPGMDAKPVLADLDRDGRMEILGATEESGLYALRPDGSTLWQACLGGGNAEPTVADLNLDGWPEVVHVNDGSVVTVLNGQTGATKWGYRFLNHFNLGSGSIPIGAAVGQLDQLGGLDIVVALRDSHDGVNYTSNHAMLAALSTNGALLWATQDVGANPLTYGHPVIADAANDGTPEVYWGDWNTMGHKPPPPDSPDAWKVMGPAHYYRFDNKGVKVWMTQLNTYWSNKDTPLADVDGDGDHELYVNGPGAGGDGLWEIDAATGVASDFLQIGPYKVARAPVFADLYGTGTMQLVLEVGAATSAGANGVLVYDTGKPLSVKWGQPPLPWVGNVVPPEPEPSGSFAATFTIKSPNAWWQEVVVSPDSPRTITSVKMRYNGGAWTDMSKASWGAWTASQHAPAGTRVEFLAKDAGNLVSQSLPFTWLDGTLSKRSTDGSTSTTTTTTTSTSTTTPPTSTSTTTTTPPTTTSTTSTTTSSTSSTSATTTTTTSSTTSTSGGAFSASFSVPSGVNEWWVEVAVSGNQPVAKVEAQVDGGAWTDLPKQSWGNWAKSFHVPAGSQVVFRATSGSGATALSAPFDWLNGSSGAFTATFTPKNVGNDWWVEVDVGANRALAGVDAQLNGGAWQPLTKQSWGSWAKSINAPNGTSIVFRARAADGSSATSNAVVWT